jgi:hypothetical protein
MPWREASTVERACLAGYAAFDLQQLRAAMLQSSFDCSLKSVVRQGEPLLRVNTYLPCSLIAESLLRKGF